MLSHNVKAKYHRFGKAARVGRYLKGNRRFVQVFHFQDPVGYIDVYVDANYADCVATRKSTSGGVVCVGIHVLGCWSCTQSIIALSSAESEYVAIVRGSAEGIGLRSVCEDFRTEMKLRVWTDSSAARSICLRQGIGHVKHLSTKILWVQQRVKKKELEVCKEKTEDNTADLMTKYLSKERTEFLMSRLNLEARYDEHPQALKVEVDLEEMSLKSKLSEKNVLIGEPVEVKDDVPSVNKRRTKKSPMHEESSNQEHLDDAELMALFHLCSID